MVAADSYVRRFISRGIPSLFSDLKPLYADSTKAAALQVGCWVGGWVGWPHLTVGVLIGVWWLGLAFWCMWQCRLAVRVWGGVGVARLWWTVQRSHLCCHLSLHCLSLTFACCGVDACCLMLAGAV